jgi:hypothetical protein
MITAHLMHPPPGVRVLSVHPVAAGAWRPAFERISTLENVVSISLSED